MSSAALALVACGPNGNGDDGDRTPGGGGGSGDRAPERGDGERVTGENYRAIGCGELGDTVLVTEEVGVFAAADGTRVGCDLVTVPADWSTPDGETIEIAVYRVPSTADDPALEACRDRLVAEGVDFADYTSASGARDIEAVREALGYARWNLCGLSCGTRLALTAIRDAPEAVRSVVLDSVFPLEVGGTAESAYPHLRAIEQIGINCAADTSCAAEHDDIRTLIGQGLARLEANPIPGLDVIGYVERLGNETANPRLAVLIEAVATGTETEIGARLDEVSGLERDGPISSAELPEAVELPEADSVLYPCLAEGAEGVHAAVICAEEFPFVGSRASPDIAADFPETTRRIVTESIVDEYVPMLCSVFELPAAGPIEIEPVRAATPALVLAGTADVQTPSTWSMLASEALPNATCAEFAGLGHGLLGHDECANRITRSIDAGHRNPKGILGIGWFPSRRRHAEVVNCARAAIEVCFQLVERFGHTPLILVRER